MLNKRRDAKHLPCEIKLRRLTWRQTTNTFGNTFNLLPNYLIGFTGFLKINYLILREEYGKVSDCRNNSEEIKPGRSGMVNHRKELQVPAIISKRHWGIQIPIGC